MAPDDKPEEHAQDNARQQSTAPDTTAAEAALRAKLSRKRTKTGCLTCRKRRIKCGEERPICRNCIKSKRHCEGYNQRVVFKQPAFDYQPAPNGGAHITFPAAPLPGPPPPHHGFPPPFTEPSGYGQVRHSNDEPHFVTVYDPQLQQQVTIEQSRPSLIQGAGPVTPGEHPQQHFQFAPELPSLPAQGYQFPLQPRPSVHTQAEVPHSQPIQPALPVQGPRPMRPLPIDTGQYHQLMMQGDGQRMPPVTVPPEYLAQVYGQPIAQNSQFLPYANAPGSARSHPEKAWPDSKPAMPTDPEAVVPTPVSSRSSHTLSYGHTPTVSSQHWTPSTYIPRPELARPIDYQPPVQSAISPWAERVENGVTTSEHSSNDYYEYAAQATACAAPPHILHAAAVETQDDDYFDVGSDEEMDIDSTAAEQHGELRQQTLSRILALNQMSNEDLRVRRYDTFIYRGILDDYRPEQAASPLKNPATARVFAHFITATGPSFSIFERHPRNTSAIFTEGTIPLSQQGLWTYRMPLAALHNQGLLHAMLALASLHIARLQNEHPTSSMKHYSWALKRIHASVGKNQSRLKVTTIAATMLLGFYEVMAADHSKWNLHLNGARQLFVETDFVSMAKEFRGLKRAKAARFNGRKRRHSSEELFDQDDLLDQIPDVDEHIISHLSGREIRYDDHGTVESPYVGMPTTLDLSKFEILKDLYWWYCKQDVYQSIVSGNPLLMDYSRWTDCPPRAPLGKPDAVYGSFDHLVLLLGRIADFRFRDTNRKLRQMEANGGQWRPATGMNIPQPPQNRGPPPSPVSATNIYHGSGNFVPPSPSHTYPSQMPVPPPFYGMAPPPRTSIHMPSSYAPPTTPNSQGARPPPSPGSFSTSNDPHHQTTVALQEYATILTALQTFRTVLLTNPAFHPMSPETHPATATSFGPTKFYRSYDISCLWAIYNMAQIITLRSHPHMPPAMHAAAYLAHLDTDSYAQDIGRIAAGIVPNGADHHPQLQQQQQPPLNPSLGAALCEICMPSFFAAIQYTDPTQRHETISRIRGIAKRTGWGSAELIAAGCETAWVKAAAAGRGPAYTRIARREESEDPRMNGSWEKVDRQPSSAERGEGNDDYDRRLIGSRANARLNWAIGVMGVEEDLEKIRIEGD